MSDNPFGEVISSYTRAQAIEDGVLIDVTETARKAGFKFHTVITADVDALCNDVGDSGEDYAGRLWDILFVANRLARSVSGDRFNFKVSFAGEDHDLWMHCGPGDNAEPVITIMLKGED